MDVQLLDVQQAGLLTVVEGWTEERLAFRPSANEWSAAEVFDHLATTEREILSAAKAGLLKPHRIGVRDRLGYMFLEKVFTTDRKVKVPASAKSVLPRSNPQVPDILVRWRQTRHTLGAFYHSLTPQQMSAGIFRHPVAGWMNMPHILSFLSLHMRHHAYQLARLRDATER